MALLLVLVIAPSAAADDRAAGPPAGGGAAPDLLALFPETPPTEPAIEPPATDARDDRPLRRHRPPAGGASTTASSTGTGWLRTTASLAGVVALILLLAWGYRAAQGATRRLPGLRGRGAGILELAARLPLGPRQSVCLVRVGPRLVLIGLTGERISALDVIDDGDVTARLAAQAQQRRPDSHTAAFQRVLEESAAGGPESPSAAPGPDDSRLEQTRARLAGALARLRATGTA
jgi:flagellar biogenesis protein FliO